MINVVVDKPRKFSRTLYAPKDLRVGTLVYYAGLDRDGYGKVENLRLVTHHSVVSVQDGFFGALKDDATPAYYITDETFLIRNL